MVVLILRKVIIKLISSERECVGINLLFYNFTWPSQEFYLLQRILVNDLFCPSLSVFEKVEGHVVYQPASGSESSLIPKILAKYTEIASKGPLVPSVVISELWTSE